MSALKFKTKDLILVPDLLALALQADGWFIRSEIVWAKPNPMPESVADRPTCAHEKVWLLTKSAKYFYDAEAIAEEAISPGVRVATSYNTVNANSKPTTAYNGNHKETRNARNVWSIASEQFRGAHYAVMPSALAERCIKAGTSERGCCPQCGKPWERVVERTDAIDLSDKGSRFDKGKTGERDGGDRTQGGERFVRRHNGDWRQTCSCEPHEPVPCSVLDPFGGAGTTGLVADRLGRDATLIELNPANRELGAERVRMDGPLFAEVSA